MGIYDRDWWRDKPEQTAQTTRKASRERPRASRRKRATAATPTWEIAAWWIAIIGALFITFESSRSGWQIGRLWPLAIANLAVLIALGMRSIDRSRNRSK